MIEFNLGILSTIQTSGGVHRPDACFEAVEVGWGDQVGFVEDDDIGKGNLFLGLAGVIDVLPDVLGVD